MAIRFKGKELSAREQAAKVREWTGWTKDEYRRRRDVLYNRARTYEKAVGLPRGSIDVAEELAKDARRQYFAKYYGEEYKPTNLFAAISATPASSSGRPLSEEKKEKIEKIALKGIENQYRGLLNNSIYSADIRREAAEQAESMGRPLTVAEYEEIIKKYGKKSTANRLAMEEANAALPWYKRRQPES